MVISKIQNHLNKFKNFKILILFKLVPEDIIHLLCPIITIYIPGEVVSMVNADKVSFKKIQSQLKSRYQ